ncbi:MAG: ATPase AAA [Cyanobium sp. CACIAM 14]|nr:MAG: ATPase AAA [Cyanobium sp. CACIAM 14]
MDSNVLDRPGDPIAFTPGVSAEDRLACHWLRQVTLRLRREICWLWRERSQQSGTLDGGPLPPCTDRTVAALDLTRYARDRRAFFEQDITARYLSDQIAQPPPSDGATPRGSFGWVAGHLQLKPVECFVLALALLPSIDSACGHVIATCHNDPSRSEPTLALGQRLWDDPDALLHCFDPAHALLRHGLFSISAGPGSGLWHAPLHMEPTVARELLFPGQALPAGLENVSSGVPPSRPPASLVSTIAAALRSGCTEAMRILPIVGAPDAPLAEVTGSCTGRQGLLTVRPSIGCPREQLPALLTTAWLRGHVVFLPVEWLGNPVSHEGAIEPPPLPGLPLLLVVGSHERGALARLGSHTLPAVTLPALTYAERLHAWQRALPSLSDKPVLAEVARRFRCEQRAITRIGNALATLGRPPEEDELLAAARADLDLGTLAKAVVPRFTLQELMLPALQTRQVEEIVTAMNNLTRVHYEWGTARAWSESGLAALFAGPPGTGKTMAAEAMAIALQLPLYRIDLSQVVNKYIGETEKNLRTLFDAADAADIILFFDEADALFGKRTEVKDAHDRYANLEISYLLERMERFKGLAILATNRRKDLDEAFLRRLRFVIEFPLPGPAERLRIWRTVIPAGVDARELDFEFLAERFPLSGGHIRAIVFQACLQSAHADASHALSMPILIRAVQREYDKLERASSLDQFGPYAPLVAAERSAR